MLLAAAGGNNHPNDWEAFQAVQRYRDMYGFHDPRFHPKLMEAAIACAKLDQGHGQFMVSSLSIHCFEYTAL